MTTTPGLLAWLELLLLLPMRLGCLVYGHARNFDERYCCSRCLSPGKR